MRLRVVLIMLVFISEVSTLSAQSIKKYIIAFHASYGNVDLLLNNSYYSFKTGDSIQFETLKFYISGIEFLNNNKMVWKEENSFHLIDAEKKKSLTLSLNTPENISFNQIKFNLGIDSTTNVSGALGGDLDPTLGMYWTWQSGYINFKLEGKSNLCKTRNNEFQFHLGGYSFPDNTLQTVTLNVQGNESTEIILDLEKLIGGIDLSKENQIMTPGKEAVFLSEKLSKVFSIQQ